MPLRKRSIQEIPLRGKRVLMRVDFDVPLDAQGRVTEEDVEHGGRYDAWSATITLWTHAWPPPWRAHATEKSLPKGGFHVAWGRPPGVWLIEVQEGFTLAELLQELGRLELIGLGYLKHGKRPAAS
jgi:hypothetical protein